MANDPAMMSSTNPARLQLHIPGPFSGVTGFHKIVVRIMA
jgi:hypothetical protein